MKLEEFAEMLAWDLVNASPQAEPWWMVKGESVILSKAVLSRHILQIMKAHDIAKIEVKPEPKADFSGWIGHTARMADGRIVHIHGKVIDPVLLIGSTEQGAMKGQNLSWYIDSGKCIFDRPEYDLVELLSGPSRNRKEE